MEAIMEFLFTIVIGIVDVMKFKNSKTRTRAMTVIFILLIGVVTVVPICGAVSLSRQGSVVGAIVMGVIALAFVIFGTIIVIRGHKTNWKKY